MRQVNSGMRLILGSVVLIFSALGSCWAPAAVTNEAGQVELVRLPITLPLPSMSLNGPAADYTGPHVEVPNGNPMPKIYAPVGVTNVALGKSVTASIAPFEGRLEQICDGKKDDVEEQIVRLRQGLQWVQIDLGGEYQIYGIMFWHDQIGIKYFCDVVVQVADDPLFQSNVRTLFNNDWDNSSGLGIGTDKEYQEFCVNKLIDAKGTKARYVRLYSNGYHDARGVGDKVEYVRINEYQEVEVHGLSRNESRARVK